MRNRVVEQAERRIVNLYGVKAVPNLKYAQEIFNFTKTIEKSEENIKNIEENIKILQKQEEGLKMVLVTLKLQDKNDKQIITDKLAPLYEDCKRINDPQLRNNFYM